MVLHTGCTFELLGVAGGVGRPDTWLPLSQVGPPLGLRFWWSLRPERLVTAALDATWAWGCVTPGVLNVQGKGPLLQNFIFTCETLSGYSVMNAKLL